MGPPPTGRTRGELVQQLRTCVDRLCDKYNTPAGAALATLLYIRGITGGLYFLQGVEAPDLEAIVARPESEAGQKAAAIVRAAVMQEVMPFEGRTVSTWPQRFWNEALLIDECHLTTPPRLNHDHRVV